MSRSLFKALAVASLAIATLASCGGGSTVGNGTGPSYLILQPAGGIAGATTTTAYHCVSSSIAAFLYFTDGSAGNFTARVVWSSSDPGVVNVSNGDIVVAGGGGFYAHGTLLPINLGSAVITANYEGLSAQVLVTVNDLSNVTIQRVDESGKKTPVAPDAVLTVGRGTAQQLAVTADLDGAEKDVSKSVAWSIPSNPGIAKIGSASGILTGLGAGGPVTVLSTFPICSATAQVQASVSPIESISLSPDFGSDVPLIVDNIERLSVLATLADGTVQDIGDQSTITPSDKTVVQIGEINYLKALIGGGTVTLYASFYDGEQTFYSPIIPFTTVAGNLNSITVSPADSASLIAGSDQIVQFTATGSFDNGMSQDVTNFVNWASENTKVATIGSKTPPKSGQAVSVSGSATGQLQITARSPSDTAGTSIVGVTLTVAPPT